MSYFFIANFTVIFILCVICILWKRDCKIKNLKIKISLNFLYQSLFLVAQ